jgi:hydrogenase 3 maturation protease
MSNILDADIIGILNINPDSDLVITVGNCFRSDDGAGPYIAAELAGLKQLKIIDAGYTPENIVEDVIAIAPQKMVVIDAADFKAQPGTVRLIDAGQINQSTLSTHSIPMNVITGIISESIETKVYFIGIQAKNLTMGEGLSDEVKQAADAIVERIKSQIQEAGS